MRNAEVGRARLLGVPRASQQAGNGAKHRKKNLKIEAGVQHLGRSLVVRPRS